MDRLTNVLREAMSEYAIKGINGVSYLTENKPDALFAVITIARFQGKRFTNVGLVARVVNELIVIEEDINSKPLVDALVQAGIPREKIVLAYAGETTKSLPEPVAK